MEREVIQRKNERKKAMEEGGQARRRGNQRKGNGNEMRRRKVRRLK